MKLIFAGTPEFAARALERLIEGGHEIALVLTQPDRAAGRGMKSQPSAVKQLAQAEGLPILQPASLKNTSAQQAVQDVAADALIVAAYGLILPQAVLDLPRHGCINIHASLLPRWRGAAPIQRALLAGDRQTGITIMRMDAGLDTGPILQQEAFDIEARETAQSLHDQLADLGAHMIVRTLDDLNRGALASRPQPHEGVTYAQKLDKAEARIDWNLGADKIDRAVRAFCPFPGAYSRLMATEIKLWTAEPRGISSSAGVPGEVLQVTASGIQVACGRGSIELLELQRPGAKKLPAAEFLRGFSIVAGARFEHR